MNKKDYIYSILLYLIIVISTIAIVCNGLINGAGEGQVGSYFIGMRYFIPFTTDSNILCALSSIIMIVFCIKGLMGKKNSIPKWATIFKLTGSVSLALTFIVVLIFLGPIQVLSGRSYLLLFVGEMFFLHLLNPIIAAYSFVFIERDNKLDKKANIIALIPTIIYSIVYLMMVCVFKKWADFYSFTLGGRYYFIPIVIIVIYATVYYVAKLFINKHNKK